MKDAGLLQKLSGKYYEKLWIMYWPQYTEFGDNILVEALEKIKEMVFVQGTSVSSCSTIF